VALDDARGLQARKLGSLRPWAWGPDSFELLKPLFASVTGERRADENRFNEKIAELYKKSWSANFLRRVLAEKSEISQWLCGEDEIGVAVNSLTEALATISKIRARGHHKVVVKESLGVAGANAIRLFEPEILPAQLRNGRFPARNSSGRVFAQFPVGLPYAHRVLYYIEHDLHAFTVTQIPYTQRMYRIKNLGSL
jgi:hypothetical protein